MSEENKPGAVKEIIKSGMELGKQRIDEEHLSIKGIEPVTMTEIVVNRDERVKNGDSIVEPLSIKGTEPVTMTEITINGDTRVENEDLIVKPDSQLSNNSESQMGSFLSIEVSKAVKRRRKYMTLLW